MLRDLRAKTIVDTRQKSVNRRQSAAKLREKSRLRFLKFFIPVILQAAFLLATFAHPNHLLM
ncbi:hypothetical protein EAE69_20950 [Hafnia alvei ATCC 13337]|nr:hypothetical protein EAE69_20950 [Hafnia alvei ATCC 13337]